VNEKPLPETASSTFPGTESDRLDSWKEIATYLHRDVRTVQRWEKAAGLPVHRHATSRLRTAFAYRSELDAWWRTQQDGPESGAVDISGPEPAAAEPGARTEEVVPFEPLRKPPIRGAGQIAAALVVVGLAVTAATMWRVARPGSPDAPGAPAPPLTVVLTNLDGSADPQLAASVEDAIRHALGPRGSIEIVPPARVSRALRLMRRDVATPLTAPLGRDISLRDGGVRFVIAGTLHKRASGYLLEIQAIEPGDGRVRVSADAEAADREDLLVRASQAAARLSRDLLPVGEPRPPVEALEPVTTASLAALRLYTSAVQAAARRQWGASELLARRAAAADPQFASAYAWIGWAMRQQGRAPAECLPILEHAVELSANTTDREVYFIEGTRDLVSGNVPSAVAAYEAALRLQPRDRTTTDLLIESYSRAGRIRDAVDLSVARGERDPGDFYANVRAAQALVVWEADRRRASPFVQRAQQLVSPAVIADRPKWAAWVSALPVFDAWLAGNSHQAFEALAALERGLGARIGRERDAFATAIGFSYLAFGRLRQARAAFMHASMPTRQLDMAMLSLASGNEADARTWLLQVRQHSAIRPALFARVGLLKEAERGLETQLPSEYADGHAEVTRGLIALRRGDRDGAAGYLRHGLELLRFTGQPEYFFAVEALARIWSERGEVDRAAEWLGDASEQRARTYGAAQWTAGAWIGVNADLLKICRRRGRREQAQRLSALLQQTLRDADEQHVVVKTLRDGGV
jgi:tetratricopeptide (TPR) repeat protein